MGFGNFDFACSPTPQGWSYEFQGTCDYSQPFWVKRLTNIPDVSNRINCRWNQLRKGPLQTDSLMQLIDDRLADMGDAPSRNFNRWNVLNNYIWPNFYVGETYQDEITYLKLWLNDRLNWMDENIIGECTISNVEVPSTVYSPIGLFPNPAREYLYVDIDYANLSNMHLKINNPLGELVLEDDFQSNVQRLDISKLPSGLYTVNVLRGNYVVGTKTLVIQ